MNVLKTYPLSAMDVGHYDNGMVELIARQGINISGARIQEMFDLFETL